jgi:hypothetical protein
MRDDDTAPIERQEKEGERVSGTNGA